MRNVVIVDTSIALKWVMDEDDSAKASALLSRCFVQETTVLAPTLLMYELTNAIYKHVRKGEIDLNDATQALDDALLGFVEFDSPGDSSLSRRAIQLAHQYKLSATYDAHYIALAERENCEYWTADERLWNAVKGKLPWVRWLGDYRSSPS
jgi:predicted nucleic acid-binding protein